MYRTILVAFVVEGDSPEQAQTNLMAMLPQRDALDRLTYLDSWWVATDERYDRSDLAHDSAIFVGKGQAAAARRLIVAAGLDDPICYDPEPTFSQDL